MPKRLSIEAYYHGIRAQNRSVIARAITLVESRKQSDIALARQLIQRIIPHTGGAIRLGLSGLPGVGKSTLLDALGMHIISSGCRLAVLAIDPSSTLRGGSILGDKTRMHQLSHHPKAYIRPTASDQALGGVARKTREALLICEAAGFDVVIVETVGVGQSEVTVAGMVDCFVAMMLPGGGDELQGIKKGVLEIADIIVINKADGKQLPLARATLREHRTALRYIRPRSPHWTPMAMMTSATTEMGIAELWSEIRRHHHQLVQASQLDALRIQQQKTWMQTLIDQGLSRRFRNDSHIQKLRQTLEDAVCQGQLSAAEAAETLLNHFLK